VVSEHHRDRGVDVVLFDLGGVLVDFGGVEPMKQLSGITDDEEIWRRWLSCRWVRDFERGGCTASEFAAGVVADWDLPITPDEFLECFRGWLGGPLRGAAQLVAEVAGVVTVGCLSNTNALHWEEQFSRWAVVSELEHRLFSYELGAVKPDREIYERALARLGAAAHRVVFLDDNQINVDGAAATGLVARRARGVDEARAALEELGVLSR
jgi:FMN phosphatase YigB (HAD superfamily)